MVTFLIGSVVGGVVVAIACAAWLHHTFKNIWR